MSTFPLPDIKSEAKAEVERKVDGQELRKRKTALGNEAPGASQRDQEMTQQRSSICLTSKDPSSDFSPLVIHLVTGGGSWFWPFQTCNGDIYIKLFDGQGSALSEKIAVRRPDASSFKPDEICSCKVPKGSLKNPNRPPEKVSRIEVFNDYKKSCLSRLRQWHLDKVVVENTESCSISTFPYKGWIKAGDTKTLNADDHPTILPKPDKYSRKELEDRRKIYQYRKQGGKATIPAQVDKLPNAEKFPFAQKGRFVLRFLWNTIVSLWKKARQNSWKSLDDLLTVYKMYTGTLALPPVNKNKIWMDDVHFGNQRINGLNHSLIKLCRELPESLTLREDMVMSHLNGLTLKEAMEKRRLFVVDLEMLRNIPAQDGLELCAPIGLFFSNDDDELLPVAIRLERDGPIFWITSHSITWQLVKLWFNNADAIYHQSVAHLGLTHLLMEGVAVATNRQLASRHPVYKLLKPHFLYMMAINDLAKTKLMSKGGFLDKTLNTGAKGTLELIAKELKHWRLDVNGTLPASLESRGLLDPDVLPSYHYREDALALYHAIRKYVTEYVNLYYDQPEILQRDVEIQAWAAELARDRDSQEGGCGLKGVPGFRPDVPDDNGKLEKVDQLVTILTSVIFTCSVEHASVNFPQYEEFGYPINYTSLLKGSPPRNDRVYTKENILEALPTPDETMEIMVVTDVLSQKHTNSLGQFETLYLTESKPLACLTAFQGSLQEIQREIAEKNDSRRSYYKHLDPLRIPNAISI